MLCNNITSSGNQLHPLTYLKLYKTITLTSALYGCELWSHLSKVEYEMIERLQRFCCKRIQSFGRRTRSNICCSMLGLPSLESYIDTQKLKFLRRLMNLPSDCASKQIFTRRLFHAQYRKDINKGFCNEIYRLCEKYNLEYFLSQYIKKANYPDKRPWKMILRNSVWQREVAKYESETKHDPDFARFNVIHPDISKPSPVWMVAKVNPHMLDKCLIVAKEIASPCNTGNNHLCEYCGYFYNDRLYHFITTCQVTRDVREQYWDILTNKFDVECSSAMHNLDDEAFMNVLLGGPCNFVKDVKHHIEILTVGFNFICKVKPVCS